MRHAAGKRIVVNGLRIAYQQLGFGPPLILIHGLATNRAFWYAPIARRLARRFQVTLYDLRGHGFSDMTTIGYRPVDMVDDLRALMDGLGIERAHVVGHSFGGAVALSFAAAHPERVTTLGIADSRVNTLQPIQSISRISEASLLESAIMHKAQINPHEEEHLGIRLLEEIGGMDPADLRTQAITKSTQRQFVPFSTLGRGERVLRQWRKLVATTSASADFRSKFHLTPSEITQVRPPALLIYGGLSRCLATGERLQELMPAARLVVVPDVGHFHPVLRPRIFLTSLLWFFRSQRLTDLMRSARVRHPARTVET